MTVRWEKTSVGGGDMRLYASTPSGASPRPVAGVVVAMHGLGLDANMLDVVHGLGRAGYAAVMPDLFHRQPADIKSPLERLALMRDDEIMADMNAAADWLAAQPGPVAPLGVMGFCMGGRVAYLMAGASRRFAAAAVYYGGDILKAQGSGPSPFERSKDIACPVLGLWGDEDEHAPVADMRKVEAELERLGKWHEFHVYRGANHGFINFTSPERHRPRAARAAWGELLAFFEERLGR